MRLPGMEGVKIMFWSFGHIPFSAVKVAAAAKNHAALIYIDQTTATTTTPLPNNISLEA